MVGLGCGEMVAKVASHRQLYFLDDYLAPMLSAGSSALFFVSISQCSRIDVYFAHDHNHTVLATVSMQ